jgi:two-component system, chemotaxis family, chemotaxis protein CheY
VIASMDTWNRDTWLHPDSDPSPPPFTVTLRHEVAPQPRTAPILVVDDDESLREMVGSVLRSSGYSVRLAADGLAALAVVMDERPALVLLDARMPRLDGHGFARELRDRGVRVPIVVMTAARDAGRVAQEIGADASLPKPFDIDELLTLVSRHVERVTN